jgi:uncharacterized BrkB/YihY/UPF0761 family membrane protein
VTSLRQDRRPRARRAPDRACRLAWFLGFYNGDNLTYAASIAYYALLSLFPFFDAGARDAWRRPIVAARDTVLKFVLRYFPQQFEVHHRQLDSFRDSPLRFGIAGSLTLIWGSLGFSARSAPP